jgi:hypothetical protein
MPVSGVMAHYAIEYLLKALCILEAPLDEPHVQTKQRLTKINHDLYKAWCSLESPNEHDKNYHKQTLLGIDRCWQQRFPGEISGEWSFVQIIKRGDKEKMNLAANGENYAFVLEEFDDLFYFLALKTNTGYMKSHIKLRRETRDMFDWENKYKGWYKKQ